MPATYVHLIAYQAVSLMLLLSTTRAKKVEIEIPAEWVGIYHGYGMLRDFTLGDCIEEAMLSDIKQTSEIMARMLPVKDGFKVKVLD